MIGTLRDLSLFFLVLTRVSSRIQVKMSGGQENEPGNICLPIDNRTFADYQSNKGYIFNPRGGMSEGVPYLAGVIALGLQVNPDLTPEEIETLLRQSATPSGEAFIVNPAGFIGLAEQEAVAQNDKTDGAL